MKYSIIFDIDDSLGGPSPYKQVSAMAPKDIRRQNEICREPWFLLALSQMPRHPWIVEESEWIQGAFTHYYVTGRWPFVEDITIEWLQNNRMPNADHEHVVFLSFSEYQKYLDDKFTTIQAIINMIGTGDVFIIDDNIDVLSHLKARLEHREALIFLLATPSGLVIVT